MQPIEHHEPANTKSEKTERNLVDMSNPKVLEIAAANIGRSDPAAQMVLDKHFGSVTIDANDAAVKKPVEIAKNFWEHPTSAHNAADRAVQALKLLGVNAFGMQEAERWLNDHPKWKATDAARAFNAEKPGSASLDRTKTKLTAGVEHGVVKITEQALDPEQ